MVEIKHKKIIDELLLMPCQNLLQTISSGICGEGRTQVPLILLTMIDPLVQDPG